LKVFLLNLVRRLHAMRLRAIGSIIVGIILMFTSTATTGRQRRAADEGAAAAPMSLIRGATFGMGTDAAKIPFYKEEFNARRDELFAAEVPRHTVTIGSFYLDRHEVTNARFGRFLARHPAWRKGRIPAALHNGNYLKHWDGDVYPQGRGAHPVVNVSWYAAVAFCRAEGKRLPTEAEWEYAARGGLATAAFPWGDEMPDKTRANFFGSGIGGTTAVGSYPANGYGLFDMAGNVWEYLADEWGLMLRPRNSTPWREGSCSRTSRTAASPRAASSAAGVGAARPSTCASPTATATRPTARATSSASAARSPRRRRRRRGAVRAGR
jgi:formylglycine-generating enzyme required for sulfatase activity